MENFSAVTTWLRENNRLMKEFASNQSKVRAFFLTSDYPDITSEQKKLEKPYQESVSKLKKRHEQLQRAVQGVKDNIIEYALNGSDLQRNLENVEYRLTNFKKSIQEDLDRLLIDEKLLYDDLCSFEDSMPVDAESTANHSANVKVKGEQVMANRDKDITSKAVIGNIDRQLASLGRYGDWDPRDHDVFLKIWTQLNIDIVAHLSTSQSAAGTGRKDESASVDQDIITISAPIFENDKMDSIHLENLKFVVTNRNLLVRKLVKLLPGCSVDDIERHINWYVQVTKLQDIKKTYLNDWKHMRQRDIIGKMQQDLLIADLNKPSVTSMEGAADHIIDDEERRKTKEKIEGWRKLRQANEMEKKREMEEKQANELRRKEEEKRERQEVLKLQLRKWKEEDNSKVKSKEATDVTRRRASSADPAEMMRRRARDIEVGKERFAKATQKIEQSQMRRTKQKEMEDEISVTVYAKVKRDPVRLQSATKAVKAQQITKEYLDDVTDKRLNASAHSRPIAMSGRDIRLGIRAIPTWRKGM